MQKEPFTDDKLQQVGKIYVYFAEPKECSQSQFKCNSTKCIPYLWQCDGDNDCGDWSDEQKCSNRTCIDDYFKCAKSGKCIPKAWECDGENDCGKGYPSDEDETTCSK